MEEARERRAAYCQKLRRADEEAEEIRRKAKEEAKRQRDAILQRAKEEAAEAYGEIGELEASGELFSEDDYEPYIDNFKRRPTVVKALCLHIAHDCNLACRYCFAGEGEYHGERALMSYEVGKQALDFLVANSGNRRNLEVDFFGGEPLLNFQVVKDLVAYGRSLEKEHDKHFRFTLTTNGVLLNDDVMDFVNREMDNVVLSIDGRKEVHNRMRPFRNGGGSYDLIVPKFQKLADSRGQERYYVRGTFTRNNLDFSEDVLHLADLGFKQISVEPVVAQESDDYALREEDLPKLFAEYDRLAAEMVRRHGTEKDFNFFHFMIDLEGGPCVAKRLSGCDISEMQSTVHLSSPTSGSVPPAPAFPYCSGRRSVVPAKESRSSDTGLICWRSLFLRAKRITTTTIPASSNTAPPAII